MSFRLKFQKDPPPDVSGSYDQSYDESFDMSLSMDSPNYAPNTAQLLKSFIKENLHEKTESYGAASSSDESTAELDMLRYQQGFYYNINPPSALEAGGTAVTPEPQPLTRTNITLHDDIWNTDKIPEDKESDTKESPLSLSPPLKNLQIMRPPEERKPWERGASILDSLSDAESDQSYSSQDTMILKRTDTTIWSPAKYLEMFASKPKPAPVEEPSRPMSRLGRSRSMKLVRQKATSGSRDNPEPGSSQPKSSPIRKVHFAEDLPQKEKEPEEIKAVVEEASSSSSQHRNINVDYSRILGKGDEDMDDGYESTDNASSTSSSSNGTISQPPGVDMVPEEKEDQEEEEEEETGLDESGNLKTDFGYVNCTKVASFRQMNIDLRKKTGTKGSLNLKDNSVENKLKKLFITDIDEPLTIEQDKETDQDVSERYPNSLDFSPRESSSPSPNSASTLQTWKTADLSNYSGTPSYRETNMDEFVQNPVALDEGDYDFHHEKRQSNNNNDSDGSQLGTGASGHYQSCHELYSRNSTESPSNKSWNMRGDAIPEQPKRPAPVLVDRGSPIRTYGSYNTLPSGGGGSNNQSPVHGYYGSQPNLQSSPGASPQHTVHGNRYNSQPQLHRTDTQIPNWRPISDLYKDDLPLPPLSLSHDQYSSTTGINQYPNNENINTEVLQQHHSDVPMMTTQPGMITTNASNTNYAMYPPDQTSNNKWQNPNSVNSSNRSSTSSGVSSSNLDSPQLSDIYMKQATNSDENLNTSGSTGSNDSGFDYTATAEGGGGANVGIVRPMMTPNESHNRRAPVNYTLDDTSRDPMRLVDKVVRRRRDASPLGRVTSPVGGSQTGDRAVVKPPLLCPAGLFLPPSGKDFSRLRGQSRPSSISSGKQQPMKALPPQNTSSPETDEDTENVREAARKMLDSQHVKLKDDYSKYVQLYSKVQRPSRSDYYYDDSGSGSDVTSRRSSLPDDQLSGPVDAERQIFNEIKHNIITQNSMEPVSQRQGCSSPTSPGSNIKYMSSADIFKMMEDRRGQASSPRPYSTSPVHSEAASSTARWSFYSDNSDVIHSTQESPYGSFVNNHSDILIGRQSEEMRGSSPTVQSGRGSYEQYVPEQQYTPAHGEDTYGQFGKNTLSRRSARNADIFNLYTNPYSQGRKAGDDAKSGQAEQKKGVSHSMNV